MNDVLINTVIEHTNMMFYNFSITLKTCNINATTIYNTNKWPKVLGMYWLDKIDDCEDINDLYE